MASSAVFCYNEKTVVNSPSKQIGCKLLVAYSDSSDTEEEKEIPETLQDTDEEKEIPETLDDTDEEKEIPETLDDTDEEKEIPETLQDRRSVSSFDSETDSSSSTSELESSCTTSDSEDDSDEDTDWEISSEVEGSDDAIQNKNAKIKAAKKERQPGRTRGELGLEDLPPIEDLKISVEQTEVQLGGEVFSVVDSLVVIQTALGTPALNLDTMLFYENGKAFGQVFDVFGPVKQPLYAVRFNCPKDIEDRNITVKMPIYFAPQKNEFTSFIFAEQLQRMKGCDASWKHDNEPPEECLEYSDDEQERMAKSRHRVKKYNARCENHDPDTPSYKKKRRNFTENTSAPLNDSGTLLNGFDSTAEANVKNTLFLRPPTFRFRPPMPGNPTLVLPTSSSSIRQTVPEIMPSVPPASLRRLAPAPPSNAVMPYWQWGPTLQNTSPEQGNSSNSSCWNPWGFNLSLPPPIPHFTSANLSLPFSAISNNGTTVTEHQNNNAAQGNLWMQQHWNGMPSMSSTSPSPPLPVPRFPLIVSSSPRLGGLTSLQPSPTVVPSVRSSSPSDAPFLPQSIPLQRMLPPPSTPPPHLACLPPPPVCPQSAQHSLSPSLPVHPPLSSSPASFMPSATQRVSSVSSGPPPPPHMVCPPYPALPVSGGHSLSHSHSVHPSLSSSPTSSMSLPASSPQLYSIPSKSPFLVPPPPPPPHPSFAMTPSPLYPNYGSSEKSEK